MTAAMNHLLVAPVLLPLATAALMLLLGEGRRSLKAIANVLSTALGLAIAVSLLVGVAHREAPAAFGIYLPGNWPVPFGIVLVADRLSALIAAVGRCTSPTSGQVPCAVCVVRKGWPKASEPSPVTSAISRPTEIQRVGRRCRRSSTQRVPLTMWTRP